MTQDPALSNAAAVWGDPARPLDERVRALLAVMTLPEKLAQLGSVWVTVHGDLDEGQQMAPHQHDLNDDRRGLKEILADGLGHLTRVYGTRPVEPEAGARALAATQRFLVEQTRLGIPAMVHEECLSGLTAYRAAVFPTPLAWAAGFDPEPVRRMAALIGADMRYLGVHQGLAPVLDVVLDSRWGRVEETLGEDPYLVSVLATAYVAGLEGAGVVATLKHFAGYAGSRAGRNMAPVSMGAREFADVVLPPFEMALREGGARSVMHAYVGVDGLPAAADEPLLTGLLRRQWGFEGVVVADYFGVAFLQRLHGVAESRGDAAGQALRAGVDVELPSTSCYGGPLAEQVRGGEVPVELVDRALRRVLRQKAEVGLLDAGRQPEPPILRGSDRAGGSAGLDSAAHRDLARQLAEQSIILLSNPDGVLPLSPKLRRLLVVGPCADDPSTFLGCYSFPNHVGSHHPEAGLGVEIPTLLDAARAELPDTQIEYARGCEVNGTDRSGIAQAATAAGHAELCLAVLGDRAGLFGGGTSGEGCDASDLALPGVQGELLEALLAAGTPVVLVTVTGRPYAVGAWCDRLAAHVQAFFPGEEGGAALAGVLSGRTNPSGRLPVQLPRHPGGQPAGYLAPPLAAHSQVSATDPTPLYPFGHGLGYTTFSYSDLRVEPAVISTDAETTVRCVLTNTGPRAGTEVAQLYLRDPVAQVTRPRIQLTGFARVTLKPEESARVSFQVHADRTAFTGRDLRRIVEPGAIEVFVGPSSATLPLHAGLRLDGPVREAGHHRVLLTPVEVSVLGRDTEPAGSTGEQAAAGAEQRR